MRNRPGVIIIEGHVQGLSNTRSLGVAKIPVIVVDTNNCIARYSKYCKKFFICPPYHSDELADFLINLSINERLQGWMLLPSNDHAVFTISRNRQKLINYYKVITPSLDIVVNIYDKSKLIKIADETGVPIPKTFIYENFTVTIPEQSFPVIIKGNFGLDFYKATGRKVFVVQDANQLQNKIHLISKSFPLERILIQELIPDIGRNKTVSFTAFCIDGDIKTYWMGIKLREHPYRFGTATLAQSTYIIDCYDQSVPLLKKLKYTGVCEVEYILDPRDNKFKLIEINARTWLWVGLAVTAGINFPLLIYQYLLKKETKYPETYILNIKWMNPFPYYTYSIINFIKGKINIIELIKENKGTIINALWDKRDKWPYFYYFIFIPKFLINR